MKSAQKELLFFAPYLVAASFLSAMSWPLDAPTPAATFGTFAQGRYLNGMELASEGVLVHPAEEGELVFAYDTSRDSAVLPSTIGSYAIVQHPRDMVGLYAELAAGSVSSAPVKLKTESVLGVAGQSGLTRGPGLFFGVYDRRAGRWVNPVLLLPPLADNSAPAIRSVQLTGAANRFKLGDSKILPQGTYTVSADVSDVLSAAWTRNNAAPYYIRLMIDGEKTAEFTYDVASVREGRLIISEKAPGNIEHYLEADGKLLLAKRFFSHGRSIIELVVRDYAGNESRMSWTLAVQ